MEPYMKAHQTACFMWKYLGTLAHIQLKYMHWAVHRYLQLAYMHKIWMQRNNESRMKRRHKQNAVRVMAIAKNY
jgi:hypothetical protein